MPGDEIDLQPLTRRTGAERQVELSQPLQPGWYLFRFRANAEARLRPAILANWGDEAAEPTRLPLGQGRSGAYEALIYLPAPLAQLALKLGFDCELAAFSAKPVNGFQAAAHIARFGLGVFSLSPPAAFLLTVKARRVPGHPLARVVHPFPRKRHGRRDDAEYRRWIEQYDYDNERDAPGIERRIADLNSQPLISIVMPVYNTEPELLERAIRSVRDQLYPRWELCIADDCSDRAEVRSILERHAGEEARVKVAWRSENGHTAAASNTAFEELATGDWTVLLDHDDELRPHALAELVFAIEAEPEAELIYSDEDKIDRGGNRSRPYFKPRFSWELFRGQNYLNHLSAIRSDRIREVRGWREDLHGSQDYDLYLRIIERVGAGAVHHIPKVLYHWRDVAASAGDGPDTRASALKALGAHVERLGLDYHVGPAPGSIHYRVGPNPPVPEPPVTLVIPTRDYGHVLAPCVSSILEKTTYANYEILIVDNETREPETVELLRQLAGGTPDLTGRGSDSTEDTRTT
ncbi:MAG: glycosyltransferase [Pseudomonadota bacterium]